VTAELIALTGEDIARLVQPEALIGALEDVYKSTGHAVEDVAAARLTVERAKAEGVILPWPELELLLKKLEGFGRFPVPALA
jgi:hypothetical protein